MCKNTSAPQRRGDNGTELTIATILVAWTLYVNWNSLGSRHSDKPEITQCVETELVHYRPVKSVLLDNDWDENFVVYSGHFYRGLCNMRFQE